MLYERVDVYVIDCASAAKWPPAAAVAISSRYVAFVLLRFAHEFLFNPHFDLEPDYIIRKPLLHRILDIFSIGKYCQLFTHESSAFLSVITPIETKACPDAKKCQKQPLSLEARGLPSNT